jgi:hypothetical protein
MDTQGQTEEFPHGNYEFDQGRVSMAGGAWAHLRDPARSWLALAMSTNAGGQSDDPRFGRESRAEVDVTLNGGTDLFKGI